ncbi:MAG: metallophosphoesterase [Bacteroidia bacterium]|nr:metallophosphoesterase [Bacteroidia bacterium]
MLKHCFHILFFVSVYLQAQVSIVKGPYLQTGTPNSIIVKWETNVKTDTKLSYGTNPSSLSLSYINSIPDTVHQVYIGGLNPYTKYFYAIGGSTFTLQGDTTNYFVTSPAHGTPGKYRFWITGDCGNGSTNQLDVKNKYLQYNGNRLTDGWLLLGDNAYDNGLDAEYNAKFFNIYQTDIMKHAVLWPSPGNHDYANALVSQNNHDISYYKIFNLPSGGEAGGVWSGTEAFYSYNYGNVHFVSLDSYGHEFNQYRLYDTLGPQITWLKQDLAANSLPWVVAYWHHPPYTMGSHNSDTEGELDSIRKNVLRILERYNVDFVFCGHSHSYERSKLMKGHFGYENSFNATQHHLSSSSALYNGSANSCPYIKNNSNKGTVYIVAGSAGSLGGQQTSFPHDAMCFSDATNGGSLIMDVNDNRVDFKFLCADGIVRDNFTVMKNAGKVFTYTLTTGQNATLTASWPGNYVWSNSSDTLRNHVIQVNGDTTIWVHDTHNCVADTFHIKSFTGVNELENNSIALRAFPNPIKNQFTLEMNLKQTTPLSVSLFSTEGKSFVLIKQQEFGPGLKSIPINTGDLSEGVYFLSIETPTKNYYKKLVIMR